MTWLLVLTIVDDKGQKSLVKLNFPGELDIFDIQLYVTELTFALDAVINGAITNISVTRSVSVITQEPADHADRESKARYFFNTAGAMQKWHHDIATWNEVYSSPVQFGKAGERRPTITPETTAYRNMMIAARDLGHPYNPTDARGIELDAIRRETKMIFRRMRK